MTLLDTKGNIICNKNRKDSILPVFILGRELSSGHHSHFYMFCRISSSSSLE